MRTALTAEWWWLRRRLALRAAALLSAVLVVGVVLTRWLSTDGDVAAALVEAEKTAAEAAAHGLDLPLAATYVEPRYPLAVQMPVDTAALALALLLVGLVAAALATGSEWRTGTVRLSFVVPAARTRPTVARLAVWWSVWTVVGLVGLALTTAGLTLVGHSRGLAGGVTTDVYLGLVLRGGLLVGVGALVGAALATALRSDAAVMVLALGYVLVAEVTLPGLRATSGYRSPGAQAVDFIVSTDLAQSVPVACGAAPRCDEVSATTAGSPAVHAAVVAVAVLIALAAVWRARRPLWR